MIREGINCTYEFNRLNRTEFGCDRCIHKTYRHCERGKAVYERLECELDKVEVIHDMADWHCGSFEEARR